MNRYPDKIIILEPVGGDPYHAPEWRQVYTGRCRCFLDRQSAFRTNKIMDCDYQVVIPDRNMPPIGENFKVGVNMHTDPTNTTWDLVGYVKDFARYDRVCNLYFQMVKENLIAEDVPAPAVDLSKRTNIVYDDEWLHFESVGLVNSDKVVEGEPVLIKLNKTSWDDEFGNPWAIDEKIVSINPNTGEEENFISSAFCAANLSYNKPVTFENITVVVPRYNDQPIYDGIERVFSVVLSHFDSDTGELVEFYRRNITIMKAE